jgi:hypothetical protein
LPAAGGTALARGLDVTNATDDAMDEELDRTYQCLLLDLANALSGRGAFILAPPPEDDPE